MKRTIFLIILAVTSLCTAQRGRERYNQLGRYSPWGDSRDGYSTKVIFQGTATESGPINPIIGYTEGFVTIWVNGTQVGSFVKGSTAAPGPGALGAELVTDGDFPTPNVNWTLGGGWTIGSGVATCDGTPNNNASQDISGVEGRCYLILIDVLHSAGILQVGGSTNNLAVSSSGSFQHYRDWTSDSNLYFKSAPGVGFTGSIDNASTKLFTPANLSVTSGDQITIVASNPESVFEIDLDGISMSGQLSQVQQFSNLTEFVMWDSEPKTHLVDTELNPNYDFSSGWNIVDAAGTTGWVLSGGKAVASTAGVAAGRNLLPTSGVTTIGSLYQVSFYLEANAGTVSIKNGSTFISFTGTGYKTANVFALATDMILFCGSNNTCTVSYFSVKLENNSVAGGGFDAWDAGDPWNPTGWIVAGESAGAHGARDPEVMEVGTGDAHAAGPDVGGGYCNIYTTTPDVSISQNVLTVGFQYRSSILIDTIANGVVKEEFGSAFKNHTAAGTTLRYDVVTASGLYRVKRSSGLTDFTIDNVSVFPWPQPQIGTIADLPNSLTDLEILYDGAQWRGNDFDSSIATTYVINALNFTQSEVNAMWTSLRASQVATARTATVTITNMFASTGQGATDQAWLEAAPQNWTVTAP